MSLDPKDERLPFLRGAGRYIGDITPAGCLHMAFLRSPFASAAITRIDKAAAEAAEGVVAVYTGRDLEGSVLPIEARMDEADWFSYRQTAWPVIATDRVRFVGEVVAAVIATDIYRAEDACELIEIDYEPGPVVADLTTALADGAPLVHAGIPNNEMFDSHLVTDGATDPIASAPVSVS